MSVINKVLRDLDQRARTQGDGSARLAAPMAVTSGTSSVTGVTSVTSLPANRARRGRRAGSMLLLGLMLGSLVLGSVGWFSNRGRLQNASEPQPPQVLAAAVREAGPVVALQAVTANGLPAVAAAQVASQATQASQASQATLAGASAPNSPAVVVAPGEGAGAAKAIAASAPPPVLVNLPVAAPVASLALAAPPAPAGSVQASAPPAALPAAPAPAPAAAAAVPWQDAALETVGQAQRLWVAGTRDAALELLREALQVLERSHGAELASTGSAATLALVRELARMELAQGQPAAVLALLQRHQHLLAGRADLWAVRANAAQRIGQHNEASLAYHTALRIRPGEPRWMLGAAVSLAALGQVAAAAELAEQARAIEAVSPELLAYLRQLGVPLRDR